MDQTPELQYKIELVMAGLADNPYRTDLSIPARLHALTSLCRARKTSDGVWKRVEMGGWVDNMVNSRFYPDLWIRCHREGELIGAPPWNSVQCVSWEPSNGGSIEADIWSLSFDFTFEHLCADPVQKLLYLLNTRSVPGERTYRYGRHTLTILRVHQRRP